MTASGWTSPFLFPLPFFAFFFFVARFGTLVVFCDANQLDMSAGICLDRSMYDRAAEESLGQGLDFFFFFLFFSLVLAWMIPLCAEI